MLMTEKASKILRTDETWELRAKYEKLTGKSFPLFNYDEWNSIDEWLSTLREGIEKAKNGEDMDKWTSELSETMKKRVEELIKQLGR